MLFRPSLPGFAISSPGRQQLYYRFDPPHDVSVLAREGWVLTKPARVWSAEDKTTLKQALLNVATNEHVQRLKDPYYALSQYSLHGRFTPKEVARAVRHIHNKHADWT
jgi:hypothetical protein